MAVAQYYIKTVNGQVRVFYDDGRGAGFKDRGVATGNGVQSFVGPGTTRVDPVTLKPLSPQPGNNLAERLDPNFTSTQATQEKISIVTKTALGEEPKIGTNALRYPYYQPASKDYDYVLFEFGEYAPPFLAASDKTGDLLPRNVTVSKRYENYQSDFKPIPDDPNYRPIILYMPQDISSTYAQNWQGKEISNIGRVAVAAANGNAGNIAEYNLPDGIRNAFAAMFTNAINSVPGVGGNFTLNDITSSTRGVIVNPNVEVLYDNPELREFSLKFKMTPYDLTEAEVIRQICNTFKKASLPGFGTNSTVKDTTNNGINNTLIEGVGGGNYIRVPNLVRVSFMKGSERHAYLPQYKVCAIKRVQVNYTPDGAYSTYSDGSPVSTELILSFLETKLIFREEITVNGVSL